MSNKKVLILYGTRYGSTEGVSERIAKILGENEVESLVVDLKKPPKDDGHLDFNNYNGILIGTGMRAGQWTKDVKNFVSKNKDTLNSFKGKLGFFVSSGYAAVPEQYEKIKVEYTKDRLNKLGVEKVDFYDAFGGLMDLSKTSRMSWIEKKILTLVGSQSGLESDSNSKITDLRDWNQIENYAKEFSQLL
ncbi:MAG: flavodoxin domain-containing protein [Candidatus Heimdallarchaeaceae archaeon]